MHLGLPRSIRMVLRAPCLCPVAWWGLLWHLGCPRCSLLRALLDAEAPRSSDGGEFLGFLSKCRSLRSSWLCWWRQKAQWGTTERLGKEKQVKGTEKSHYKRKILFQLLGQSQDGRELRRAGRSCLEAENPASPVPRALAPDHPEGSSLDSHQSCSALWGWAAQFRTWFSQHCLTVQHSRIVPEGGQREQAPAPCPRAQGQQERAAFAITLGPEPRGALAISTLLLV